MSQLKATPPFKDVSWDFSRTRDVRGQSAREFRLSFRIDLDAFYQISAVEQKPAVEKRVAAGEGSHDQ